MTEQKTQTTETIDEIPAFLRRQRNQPENPMPHTHEITAEERQALAEAMQQTQKPDTLEDVLKRIDDLQRELDSLPDKRKKLRDAIMAHKRTARKMIGR
jgi:DNA-binding transcriptional MerR regulator